MLENIYLNLTQSVLDSQKNLIAIFKGDEIVLTNATFNVFFGVSSFAEYKENYGPFIENFVPHPSYFNKDKIEKNESWLDAIIKLDDINRVVSMLSQSYDPQAFSVDINTDVQDYKIVTFVNITQSLIKRIMIENNVSLDAKSGAYSKNYFLQVMKSYEEASVFNVKIIGISAVEINSEDAITEEHIREFVQSLKSIIRQDDMLVRWNNTKFLLAYLIDDEQRAKQVVAKLKYMTNKKGTAGISYDFSSTWQTGNESISVLIDRL